MILLDDDEIETSLSMLLCTHCGQPVETHRRCTLCGQLLGPWPHMYPASEAGMCPPCDRHLQRTANAPAS